MAGEGGYCSTAGSEPRQRRDDFSRTESSFSCFTLPRPQLPLSLFSRRIHWLPSTPSGNLFFFFFFLSSLPLGARLSLLLDGSSREGFFKRQGSEDALLSPDETRMGFLLVYNGGRPVRLLFAAAWGQDGNGAQRCPLAAVTVLKVQ